MTISCKTKKINTESQNMELSQETNNVLLVSDNAYISMTKGMCYGRCPAYDFKVEANGKMTFTSKKFCKKEGVFEKMLDSNSTSLLFKEVGNANLFSMEDNYKSMIPDMPLTTISYNDGTNEKTIKGKLERPEALKAIQKDLEMLAESEDGWTLIKEIEAPIVNQYQYDELIVTFQDDVMVPKWIKDYTDYKLILVKQLSSTMNSYLLKYDQSKANPNVMKDMLAKDENVKSVSFNQLTTQR